MPNTTNPYKGHEQTDKEQTRRGVETPSQKQERSSQVSQPKEKQAPQSAPGKNPQEKSQRA